MDMRITDKSSCPWSNLSNGGAIPIAIAKLLMNQAVTLSDAPRLTLKGGVLWTISPLDPALLPQNATFPILRMCQCYGRQPDLTAYIMYDAVPFNRCGEYDDESSLRHQWSCLYGWR